MSDTTSNDSYTPTPSPSPPPPGGRTAQEWDQAQQLAFQLAFDNESVDSVAETRLRLHTRGVLVKPSTMDRPTYTGPLLDVSLRVLPRPADPVMHLNNMTLSAYDHAIKRKIRVGEIKRIIIHVVDFDFTLATAKSSLRLNLKPAPSTTRAMRVRQSTGSRYGSQSHRNSRATGTRACSGTG
jgi:hypothetical protein